jgi:hypothetical protein
VLVLLVHDAFLSLGLVGFCGRDLQSFRDNLPQRVRQRFDRVWLLNQFEAMMVFCASKLLQPLVGMTGKYG